MGTNVWPAFGQVATKPGSQIASELPEQLSPAREEQILGEVRAGNYHVNWVPITVQRGGLSATFWVSADALRLGTKDDSFRPAMTAFTQQKIADELNAVMPTALLSDEIFRQAHVKLMPRPLGSKNMTTMSRMLKHHNEVERQLIDKLPTLGIDPDMALIAPVGKDWVNSRRLIGKPTVSGQPAAINYGWQRTDMGPQPHTGPFPAATGYPPLVVHQSEGMAHNFAHQDYSQVARLVSRLVTVCKPVGVSGFGAFGQDQAPGICVAEQSCTLPDGRAGVTTCMDIYDVAQDPQLNVLVSHNGPVYMRQFAVPYAAPVGKHQFWGGLQPLPPPPNRVTGPAAGDHPSKPPRLNVIEAPVTGAADRIVTFAAAAAVGWVLWNLIP